MSKHTPGPWELCRDPLGIAFVKAGDLKLCSMTHDVMMDAPFPDDETQDANAEFIVRACNAHFDLLKACEAVRQHFRSQNKINMKIYGRLQAAIKKAKGE